MNKKISLKKNTKKKKRKGFTLVELLAVIVILAVIMVITIPTVIGSMNNAKLKAEEIFIASIEKAIGNFIDKELKFPEYTFETPKNEYFINTKINSYDMHEILLEDKSNITFNLFNDSNYYPKDDLINPKTNKKCDSNAKIFMYKNDKNEYYYRTKLDCLDEVITNLNVPEDPILSTGLIPVIYDAEKKTSNGTGWFVADIESKWYDYDNFWWANAVSVNSSTSEKRRQYVNEDGTFKYLKDDGSPNEILKDDLLAMFVWIPRFSYTIGCHDTNKCYGFRLNDDSENELGIPSADYPGAIDIRFTFNNLKEDPGLSNNIYPTYNYNIDANGFPTNKKEKNWVTHPAFSYGKQNLSGFWIGKFETSVDPNSTCYNHFKNKKSTNAYKSCAYNYNNLTPRILPDLYSVFYQNVGNQYYLAKKLSTTTIFGLNNGIATSSKNADWSAVAYLSQSIYGKYGNPIYKNKYKEIYQNNSKASESYWYGFTGKSLGSYLVGETYPNGTYSYDNLTNSNDGRGYLGAGASTTGTIYGVYDMVGGISEVVLGNYKDNGGGTTSPSLWNGTTNLWNRFDENDPFSTKKISNIGNSFFETKSWYKDSYSSSFSTSSPWVAKGGYAGGDEDTGVFSTNPSSGSSNSYVGFRITYIPEINL